MEPTEPEVVEAPLPDDIANGSPEDIHTRVRLIDNELRVSIKLFMHARSGWSSRLAGLEAGAGGIEMRGLQVKSSELTHGGIRLTGYEE